MEPTKFDEIIKQKTSGEHSLHQKEMKDAKPFIWATIQSNSQRKGIVIPWYAVAAAILLLCCSSFFLFQLQNRYENDIQQLSEQINHLSNQTVPEIVAVKDQQIDLVCEELKALEQSYSTIKNQPKQQPFIQKQIVYNTDTVFISKVEYITEYIPLSLEKNDSINVGQPIASKIKGSKTSNLIYPDLGSSSTLKKKSTENAIVKLKLNALTIN